MGRLAFLVLTVVGLLVARAEAAPERRVALVIGNAVYQDAGKLANPVNDATDVAAKLRSLGFEVVEGHDLGKREFERKIGEFSDALDGADVGLFFYAGHGLQIDGRNFIVPTDAKVDVPVKLKLETIQIDEVLDIMEQQAATSLVFLDACRNNPFTTAKGKASNRSASALAGLAQFDSTRGSFIAFSTAPGHVALDGAGRNSPFAAALVRRMAEPGQSINDMMIAVRNDVIAETRDQQRPFEQGSLTKRFEFVPAGELVSAPQASSPVVEGAEAKVAGLERSVGTASVEDFVRDVYLAPKPDRLAEMFRSTYASPANIFGTPMDIDALVKTKVDWFSQWRTWRLSLVPESITVTPRGEVVDVAFSMDYDYAPKDAKAAHLTGKAKVYLGLAKKDDSWRVVYETSEAMK